MSELQDLVRRLNDIVLDLSNQGKKVTFNPKFKHSLVGDGNLGLGKPVSFDLGVCIGEPLLTAERHRSRGGDD